MNLQDFSGRCQGTMRPNSGIARERRDADRLADMFGRIGAGPTLLPASPCSLLNRPNELIPVRKAISADLGIIDAEPR